MPQGSALTAKRAFGVQIHSTFGGVWADHDAVYNAVLATGVSYVRDYLAPGDDAQAVLWRRFRDAGIKVHATVGTYGQPFDAFANAAAMQYRADCLRFVAGWNEPDQGTFPDWVQPTADHQKWLYRTVKSTTALSKVHVCIAPLKGRSPQNYYDAHYQACAGFYDRANIHAYPRTAAPQGELDMVVGKVAAAGNTKPIVIGEAGYNTEKVTEQQQADLLAQFLDFALSKGMCLAVYELVDYGPVRAGWGLYHTDWTPKPARDRLHALVAA